MRHENLVVPDMVKGAIDSDGHILEPPDLFENELETKYRSRALKLRKDENGFEYGELDGKPSWFLMPGVPGLLGTMGSEDMMPAPDRTYAGSAGFGAMDPLERIEFSDQLHLSKTVIYPTLTLSVHEIEDIELQSAHIKLYNRWITEEFCGRDDSGRLLSMAYLCFEDEPEAIAEELERCVLAGAKGGFFLPFNRKRISPGHPHFDPVWAKAQELGVPLGMHPTAELPEVTVHGRFAELPDPENYVAGSGWYIGVLAFQAVQQSFVSLFHYGLFERFPEAKFVVLESQAGWLDYVLGRMDEHWRGAMGSLISLQDLPSNYFKRQCWISADPDEPLKNVVENVGADRFVWASDYPHPDHRIDFMEELAKTIEPFSETDRHKILVTNAEALYGL